MPERPTSGPDVLALLRSRNYLALLVIAALLGVVVAAVAYWFLFLVAELQKWIFNPDYLAKALGFHDEPVWWPLPAVGLAGVLVGLAIQYLPGRGGHSPADGFAVHGPPAKAELPGVALAALAGLALGAVIGPEAPLVAIGGGLAAALVRALKRDLPEQSISVVSAAGSFAAISTLLGSPLSGALLLMEASGLGGPVLGLVMVPGLLAAGLGSLVFIGFDSWTGHGIFSLAIPNMPHVSSPTGAEIGWAILVGIAAAILGGLIRRLALYLKPRVEGHITVMAPVIGLVVGGLAIAFDEGTGQSSSYVLFSGQSALPTLVAHGASFSVGALLLLAACKSLAYGASLSAFRGGPTFPGMFIGGVGGILLAHTAGMPETAGVAIGIGAMTTAMLGLPISAVLITTLILGSAGINVMPLVIVAVVVTYVGNAHFAPRPRVSPGTPASATPPATSPANLPARH